MAQHVHTTGHKESVYFLCSVCCIGPAETAKRCVEKKQKSVDFTALCFREYASKEDVSRESLAATIGRSTGAIKVRKGHVQVLRWTPAEEFHLRLVAGCLVM